MKITAAIFSLFLVTGIFAQTGYEIKVTLKPLKNQYLYLGHYYGKQLPIIDSARMNEKGEAVFKGTKKLGDGIYLVGFPDKTRNFEILIDKNQKFSVVADSSRLAEVQFVNSPENVSFKAYQSFMSTNGRAIDSLGRLRKAGGDSIALTKKMEDINLKIRFYRADIITNSPNSLLTALLNGMKEPEIPKNDPAAKTDSLFAYKYFKNIIGMV